MRQGGTIVPPFRGNLVQSIFGDLRAPRKQIIEGHSMALQVRLVHSLGDRLIELPEKTLDAPAVIGRSPDADVQVPAVTVSRRHCIMFVEDGQWILQNAVNGAHTFVNKQPIAGPTFLHSGDVITLGADPRRRRW